jgi:hypothetical protein
MKTVIGEYKNYYKCACGAFEEVTYLNERADRADRIPCAACGRPTSSAVKVVARPVYDLTFWGKVKNLRHEERGMF